MPCQFCTDPNIASRTIRKDDLVWIFPTNIPIVPGHVLVCPARCVATIEALSDKEASALFGALKEVKAALKKAFYVQGFNVALNEGAMAGQSVPHLHIHVLPRKDGDTGITQYDPRQFLYRSGSRPQARHKELDNIATRIKSVL